MSPDRNTTISTAVLCRRRPCGGGSRQPPRTARSIETIDSSVCGDCHEAGDHGSSFQINLDHSAHEGLDCLDCHVDRDTVPHRELEETFYPGCKGCRDLPRRGLRGVSFARPGEPWRACEDMPHCSDCHGTHDILPSTAQRSSVHPTNLPRHVRQVPREPRYHDQVRHPHRPPDPDLRPLGPRQGDQGRRLRRGELQRLPLHRRHRAQDPVAGITGIEHQPLQHPHRPAASATRESRPTTGRASTVSSSPAAKPMRRCAPTATVSTGSSRPTTRCRRFRAPRSPR